MNPLPASLAGFARYRQFIVHQHKIPIDPDTGESINPHNSKWWMTFETAQTYANNGRFGVGFVFTDHDPFWFIDIDGALVDGKWSQLAVDICQRFPLAACEVSQSGTGLHLFGSGIPPQHKCKNTTLHLEFYHTGRFVALTGTHTRGSVDAEYSAILPDFVAQYFPDEADGSPDALWSSCPVPEWRGTAEDSVLIEMAMRSKSPNSVFGNTASFADLWTGDVEVLKHCYPDAKRPYDCSGADAALAQHLAFWTGKDCDRILRLMWKSGLVREKWTAHKTYLTLTIIGAVTRQKEVFIAKPVELVGAPQETLAPKATVVTGNTFVDNATQIELFSGCVYIQDVHKALIPGGIILKPDQFRVHYGGYRFTMDQANEKTSKDAWEAFTQNQSYRCPRVHSEMFRPNLPPGAIIERYGRTYVNTYFPVDVPRKPGNVEPFLTHLRLLLPDTRDQEIFLSYLAACVQYQGIKFEWAPFLQGVEGNGKSLFSRCAAEAIGRHYVHWPKASKLSKEFNGWMVRKILYCVEDIYVPDHKREVIEELKPMITGGDGLEIECKNVDQFSGDIVGNFIFNSNHNDGIRKTKNDRRFCVFFTAQQQVEDLTRDCMNGDYFPNLYEWLRKDGYAHVTDFLFSYPISEQFNPATKCKRAPETSTTHTAIAASVGGVEQEIQEAIAQGTPGFCGGFISSMMLEGLLMKIGAAKRINRTARKDILKALGYIPHPALSEGRVNNKVLPDGGRPRLFVLEQDPAFTIPTGAEVAAAYEESNNHLPFEVRV